MAPASPLAQTQFIMVTQLYVPLWIIVKCLVGLIVHVYLVIPRIDLVNARLFVLKLHIMVVIYALEKLVVETQVQDAMVLIVNVTMVDSEMHNQTALANVLNLLQWISTGKIVYVHLETAGYNLIRLPVHRVQQANIWMPTHITMSVSQFQACRIWQVSWVLTNRAISVRTDTGISFR